MTALLVATYMMPSTTIGVSSLPPVMLPAPGSAPSLYDHAGRNCATFAAVICRSGE
jgi:hypothetical protein